MIASTVFACLSGGLQAQQSMNTPAVLSLDSILNVKISSAAKYEQTISEAAASVTIVTSEDIERYGYRTLDAVLQNVRGFYTSYDRNYTYVGVRGFGRPTDYNDRILLLLNGHTVNENVYGSAFIGTDLGVSMQSIERIEIVRGPGSVLYGTGAMFAVVNIITKRGITLDGARLVAETGSFGRRQGSILLGKELASGVDFTASIRGTDVQGQDVYYVEYDDPTTNNGVAHNLDWDRYYDGFANLRYQDFTLTSWISSREKAIPTGAWDVTFNDSRTRTLDERSFVEMKYDHSLDAEKNIMLRGYFDRYRYNGTFPYDMLTFDATDGSWYGGEVQFRWDLTSGNRLIVGSEYKRHYRADYRLWDTDTTYFNANFPFNQFSLYAQDEFQLLENLMLTLSVRREERPAEARSTTPRGALVYHPTKATTLKFLYGEAFRAPNVYEHYYEDPTSGYKANPDVRPEKIRTTEAIWEQRVGDHFFGTLSLHSNEVRDLIDQTIDPADSLKVFRNISRVRTYGVETEINARLDNGLSLYGSYAYQYSRDTELDRQLSNSPVHLVRVGLTFPLFDIVNAALQVRFESDRLTVYDTNIPSYIVTNLHLSTTPLFGGLECALLVENLFDTKYQTPGGFEHRQAGIPQDGRSLTVRAEYGL